MHTDGSHDVVSNAAEQTIGQLIVHADRFAALPLLARFNITQHLVGVVDKIIVKRACDGVAVPRFYAVVAAVVPRCAKRNSTFLSKWN